MRVLVGRDKLSPKQMPTQRLPLRACGKESLCSLLVKKEKKDLILAVGVQEQGGGTRGLSVGIPGTACSMGARHGGRWKGSRSVRAGCRS